MNSFNGESSDGVLCVVCGSRSNLLFRFNIFCCRACFAFHRRSITQSRQYRCIRDAKCPINAVRGQRNACRACRFKRCVDVGMCITDNEMNGDASDDNFTVNSTVADTIEQPSEPTVVQCLNYPSSTFDSNPGKYPILEKVHRSFQNILRAQKSLFIAENPHLVRNFDECEPQPITKSKFGPLENGTICLIKSMFVNSSDVYGQIIQLQDKESLLDSVARKYTTLLKGFLTRQFGSENLIFTHFGYYFDLNALAQFYDPACEAQQVTQRVEVIRPTCVSMRDIGVKLRLLELRELEAAALGAIIFWEQLDKYQLSNPSTSVRKDAMYAELHANMIEHYGFTEGGIRLVKIISLLPMIVGWTSKFNETALLCRIFLPACGAEHKFK